MVHRVWRQFRPKTTTRQYEGGLSVVDGLRARLAQLTAGRRIGIDQLDELTEAQAARATVHPTAVEWFTLLVLRAPGAARAQQHMDKHPHSYHSQQARLFELIDFNDTFVSTVLALDDRERRGFLELLKQEIDMFCDQVGTRSFSEEQFEAITRGLSREVAVYLGAIQQGFTAIMTSRAQDAMGVDMVITDPSTSRSLNIDCKTPSAYHYRIKDLVEQGRLSEQDGELAEELGYAHELNGHGPEAVAVTLLRVDPNEVGEIVDFEFTDPDLLGVRLRAILQAGDTRK